MREDAPQRICYTLSSRNQQQLRFYDEDCDPEFEIIRPHECGRFYEYVIERKFETGIGVLGLDLRGKALLEICAGSGMMSEKFARAGAIVTSTDFSSAAILRARERARRYRFSVMLAVANSETLPFQDQSFDVVSVHDGLHHLDHPEEAIREMARIARVAVLIMDPADAALTRIAVRLGMAQKKEDAGNEVKRLDPRVVEKILRGCGMTRIRWRRILMYYPHRPGRWSRILSVPPLFVIFQLINEAANLVFGRWGNKLAMSAIKRGP
jgi:SAM-dependent methyltransferase